jgi:hypothetical protein
VARKKFPSQLQLSLLKRGIGTLGRKNQAETTIVRGYFNNHYGAKAVVNALQFRGMIGDTLAEKEQKVLENAQSYWNNQNMKLTSFTE